MFSENTQKSNFMKIRPVEAELFRADGRTDVTKLIVALRSIYNAPKMDKYIIIVRTILSACFSICHVL